LRVQRTDSQKPEWEKIWGSMEDSVRERDVYFIMDEIKMDYLLPLLPNAGRTLEVGCGAAHLSCFLAARGYKTVGLDYSSKALLVAQHNYLLTNVEGSWLVGDGYQLPFSSDTFDVVLSAGLLEHFANPIPLLSEMVRVLRPRGIFYADIVPKKFSLLRALDGLRLKKSTLYEASWKKKTIITFLRKVGLQNVTVFPAGVFPPLWVPIIARLSLYRVLHARMTDLFKPLILKLDRTQIAEYLGFYYFCQAVKGGAT